METIQMTQNTAATVTGSFITIARPLLHHISCWVFLARHQITQVTQSPLQTRFGSLWLLAFPQTKITFEKEEISDSSWDSGKYNGAADGDWENGVRSQGASFDGNWGVIVLCTMHISSFLKTLNPRSIKYKSPFKHHKPYTRTVRKKSSHC